ncbi:CBN-CLEC-50 protein [Aphelenchoides avenae]|nr:CBN-CLEC-50 protein [Aphelenchus avenae]
MQGLNDQDCYHFEAVPAMWLKAEEECITRNGHLAFVSSTQTNAMLRKISSLACAKEFWLDGSWDTEIPRQWSWTDGRRFSYKNWAPGQPTNKEYYCTALGVSNGRWYSRACRTAKPYICKVPAVGGVAATTATPFSCPACPTNSCTSRSRAYSTSTVQSSTTSTSSAPPINGRCRDGWTYVAATGGKCLRITDSPDSWSNTRDECRRLGGDLVSIPNSATNYAIRDYTCRQEGLGVDDQNWYAPLAFTGRPLASPGSGLTGRR